MNTFKVRIKAKVEIKKCPLQKNRSGVTISKKRLDNNVITATFLILKQIVEQFQCKLKAKKPKSKMYDLS